ncbi:thioredoxin domain-containing protein [Agrobacterium tumefaciens]|uniref:DsbA family protein n=1 Tax=Agrobacterium tumefaciens TaxID=358 RepID=UPI001574E670|nr:thioredoxin domain-containing protein [Agrobacterium tumefaciens]NTE56856.1 thioredoxin domain-containing protein [Agrobacterium tumefaciens]NTE71825.1 thioredoxin domain-containing protein [Agrobacterium tumefaciens]
MMTPLFKPIHRAAILLGIVLILPIAAGATDLLQPLGRVDRPAGSATAPVTVIEYSSPTCSHCATYRNETAPKIEEEFVESGQIRILFRPLVRNNVDLVIFMLAETQPQPKPVLDRFYARQDEIANSNDLEQTLREIAASVGIDRDAFNAAVADQSVLNNLKTLTNQAQNDFKVEGTPTFFINGKKITGAPSLEAMRREIAAALERK